MEQIFYRPSKDSLGILSANTGMAKKVIRTDESLWTLCKKEAVESLGKFSARAMQRAVILYKERGGGYVGTKSPANPLVAWNKKQETLKPSDYF